MTLSICLGTFIYHHADLGYAFVNIQYRGFQGSGLSVESLSGLFRLVLSECQGLSGHLVRA